MKTPRDWVTRPLSEFVSLQRGFDLPTHARVPGSVPVLSSGGVNGSHNEAKVDGDNFVIGRATNIGRPTWSSVPFWPLNTTLFVKDFLGNFPKFCFYWFLATDLSGFDSGSVQPMLNRNYIANIPVAIPSFVEQRRIAEVLGALDDKIESNQNLTEIILNLIGAQVDYELSDGSGDLFAVSELARFVNGGAYTKDASGTGRMVIRIADLNSGPSASTIYNDIDVPGDRLAHFGDLLMSWSGSLGVYVWVRDEAIVNQHIFKVICTNYPAWLVHNRLNAVLHRFRSIAADKATTMGHIQRKHLDETFVEVPVTKLGQLSHLCAPLWNRFISAQLESMQLAALRDALLPELMSGRMRVNEAGRLVSEALDEEVADV